MRTVGLAEADLICVSSSGGKDSVLALCRTIDRCRALGIPLSRVVVIHADLGPLEWRAATGDECLPGHSPLSAPDLAAAQAAHFGVRFISCRNMLRTLPELWNTKSQSSLVGHSHCEGSMAFKRDQIEKVYTMLVKELNLYRAARIVEVMGLCAHESSGRTDRLAAYDHRDDQGWAWTHNAHASTKNTRTVSIACPLADQGLDRPLRKGEKISKEKRAECEAGVRAECAAIHEATGLPTLSWVYRYLPRLSCLCCVFMSRGLLARSAKLNPAFFRQLAIDEAKWEKTWSLEFTLSDVIADAETLDLDDSSTDTEWGNQS